MGRCAVEIERPRDCQALTEILSPPCSARPNVLQDASSPQYWQGEPSEGPSVQCVQVVARDVCPVVVEAWGVEFIPPVGHVELSMANGSAPLKVKGSQLSSRTGRLQPLCLM